MRAVTIPKKASEYAFQDERGWFFAAASVIATLLIANITLVVGIHSAIWDAADLGCPNQILLADYARHGKWLLWTPLLSAGCPAAVDPGLGAFSPITLGIALLTGGHEYGFRAYWLAIWGFGGIGIVVLARHFFAPRWAAYVAAVGFMFSGIYIGHAEHTSILYTMSFLPWIIWRLDAAIRRKSFAAAMQAGSLSGLSALGGYPGMVFISSFLAGLWMLVALLPRQDDASDSPDPCMAEQSSRRGLAFRLSGRFWLLARTAAVFYGVTVVVMSPTYLAYLVETRDYSDRADILRRDMAVASNAIFPRSLITSASPFFMTVDLFDPTVFPGTDVSMCSIHLFPVLLVLAAAALWQRPRDKLRWCLAGLAVFFLATAMGATLPVRGWLYDWIPPMRYFRHCGIFRCYYVFCLILLALQASRDFQATGQHENKTWKRLAVLYCLAAIVAVGVFALVCVLVPLPPEGRGCLTAGIIHLVVVWPGIAAVILIGLRKDAAVKDHILKRYLVCFAFADAVLCIVVCQPLLFVGRRWTRWDQLEASHVSGVDLPNQGLDRKLANAPFPKQNGCLVTKEAVFSCYNPLSNAFYSKTTNNPLLTKPALGTDRFWFARQAAKVSLTDEAFDRFARRAEKIQSPCLVVSLPTGISPQDAAACLQTSRLGNLDDAPPLESLTVESVEMKSRELRLDVRCPDKGWILVTDRWAHGWTATVNGREQPIAIGNFIFRALAVEKGLNRLHFSYSPFGFPWLLIASWSCWAAIFAVPAVSAASAVSVASFRRMRRLLRRGETSPLSVELPPRRRRAA